MSKTNYDENQKACKNRQQLKDQIQDNKTCQMQLKWSFDIKKKLMKLSQLKLEKETYNI